MSTSRRMHLCTVFDIRDSKIRERVLQAFRKYVESAGIEVDIHLDSDDEDNFDSSIRISIYGSSEECETAFDKLFFMVPEREGPPEEFIAPDDSRWQKKYSKYLRDKESD